MNYLDILPYFCILFYNQLYRTIRNTSFKFPIIYFVILNYLNKIRA